MAPKNVPAKLLSEGDRKYNDHRMKGQISLEKPGKPNSRETTRKGGSLFFPNGPVAVGRKPSGRQCPWGDLGCSVDTLLTFSQNLANGLELPFSPAFTILSWGCPLGTERAIFVGFLSQVCASLWKISRSTKIVFCCCCCLLFCFFKIQMIF